MKICIISNLYPPFIRGGAEIVAAMQAEALKKAWQHVFAVSTRPANVKVIGRQVWRTGLWTTTVDTIDDVEIYRFNPVNLYYYLDDFKFPGFIRAIWHLLDIFNIFSYFKIKKIIAKEKPDLVITHNLTGIGFLIPSLLRRLKLRHVHVVHDVQLVTPSGLIIKGKEQSFEHRFFRYIGYVRLMRKLMGSPEIVISPSKFLMSFYQESGFFSDAKKHILPNPIKGLVTMPRVPSVRLELVYLGQIHKSKGILDLIQSIQKIKLPHLRLNIIGVGPDLQAAKALAKDDKRIVFHGWLPHGRLMPVLAKMDLMVVPSLCYENSPTVVYESLSIGLPVLAADIGGTAELIEPGVNGWKFPAGEFGILNRQITSIYQQREKLAKMAENCRYSVRGNVLDKYSEKLLAIINDK